MFELGALKRNPQAWVSGFQGLRLASMDNRDTGEGEQHVPEHGLAP